MMLDLREFESFPASTIISGNPDEFRFEYESFNRVIAIEHILNIQKASEEYFCQGEVRAEIEIECARCLNPFTEKISNKTDFIVCSETKHEDERYKDDEDYAHFKDGDLIADITEITRQAVVLSISMKPLCSEDCKGICPNCGINLNDETCQCNVERIDPRWEALKKLSGKTLDSKE